MQARITLKGNTAKGHELTVYLPKEWLEQFGINAPSVFGERLKSTWGEMMTAGLDRYLWEDIGVSTGEVKIENIKQDILCAKQYLRDIKATDKEILVDL